MTNEDMATGRCQDWLADEHWKQFGHFNWEDRAIASRQWIISPEDILRTIRGDAAYMGFTTDPLAENRILDFNADFYRLNMKLEDWTTARCFWPKPGDIKVPYHWFFFGTKADILMLQMVLQP